MRDTCAATIIKEFKKNLLNIYIASRNKRFSFAFQKANRKGPTEGLAMHSIFVIGRPQSRRVVSRRVASRLYNRGDRDRVRGGSSLPTRPRALVWLLEGDCRVGKVGGWGRRRSRERGIDLQWVRMSAGIDSTAMQRGFGGGETGIREYRDAAPGRTGARSGGTVRSGWRSGGTTFGGGRGPGGLEDQGDGVVGGWQGSPDREGSRQRTKREKEGATYWGKLSSRSSVTPSLPD